ncbi:ArnT family glycosyltransferase [Christiangramia aquimixticola]|uniref:ArnT family glycosyltransferase n=1 Tax=Christiangramia aquimixticola TaxID=1697558 RepID=UPI003AA90BDF
MKLKDNYLLLLIFVCLGIFFVNLDAIYVNIMEARNFITAREMLTMDHWIFTTINNEPRYEKPPLPTWLTAISMALFGIKNLFAARLPAAIMGSILTICIYKFGIQFTARRKYAFISALIAATSFYIVFSGRDGQWDIHTHAWMMLAIVFLFKLFTTYVGRYWYAVLAGVCMGASFLSKGPVSMYVLLLPFLMAYAFTFKFKEGIRLWKPLILMLIITVVISSSWALYVYLLDTGSVTKITEKETGRWLDYNVRPFYYYWSFVIQSGIWTIPSFIALLYPYLKNRVFNIKAYQFTLLWTLLAVVLLSIIPEKKSRYLLPVLIPMALNTGFYIEYLFRRFEMMSKKEKWPVNLNFIIIALVGLLFPFAGLTYFGKSIYNFLPWFVITSLSLAIIGGLILLYLRKNRIKPVFYLTVWFIISIIFFGLPISGKIEKNIDYSSISIVDHYIEDFSVKAYEFKGFTPEMIWEFGRPIEVIYNGKGYDIPIEEKFLVLATKKQKPEMFRILENYKIEKVDEIDMNPVGNKHKPRLYRNLYLVTK